MPSYIYKARDVTGKIVKGTMDASSKEEIIDKLHKMGYMTTQVAETLPGIKIQDIFEKLRRINSEDMIMFNVQLANMINAGIPLLTSLHTLSSQIENRRLKESIGEVSRSIEGGDSFSQALARHPHIFSKLFVNMVRSGEVSGKLDVVLLRYADFFERYIDLRQRIKGALFYPCILLFVSIMVILFIVTFIIPQFAEIFIKTNVTLPTPTLILYKVGTGIRQFWYSIGLFIIVGWFGIAYYVSTDKGRFFFDKLKLKLPLVGALYRKASISMFSRTLGTLVASGVSILESLDIVADVVGNKVLGYVITNARSSVERGEGLAESLKISEEFPTGTVQMISVGEKTGDLDGMLNKIADFYDMLIGYAIKRLSSVLEPLFLVVMGGLVGFIMASMLLPIFDMMKILRH